MKECKHLAPSEYDNLVRLCSAVADDPSAVMRAVMTMLNSVPKSDAEWLKIRLKITGDNSQAPQP